MSSSNLVIIRQVVVQTDVLRESVVLCRLQGQVHEVVDVMRDNIGKVMERGDRLEDLQDKSGESLSMSMSLSLSLSLSLQRTKSYAENTQQSR